MTPSHYTAILDEAFENDWPEWLRLATPREQEILARAIETPDTLTEADWRALREGPTACGLYNLDANYADSGWRRWTPMATIVATLAWACVILTDAPAPAEYVAGTLMIATWGLTLGLAIWRAYCRLRYHLRLVRARSDARRMAA